MFAHALQMVPKSQATLGSYREAGACVYVLPRMGPGFLFANARESVECASEETSWCGQFWRHTCGRWVTSRSSVLEHRLVSFQEPNSAQSSQQTPIRKWQYFIVPEL